MFDYLNYSLPILLIGLMVLFILLFFCFKRFLSSSVDPLLFHILWLSLGGALLFAYPFSFGLSEVYFVVIVSYVSYIFFLWFGYLYFSKKKYLLFNCEVKRQKDYTIFIFIFFSLLIYIFSKKDFIDYLFTVSTIIDVFAWRVIDMQGRDPLSRILNLGVWIILLFYVFYALKFSNNFLVKLFALIALVILLVFDIASGGRSAVLSVLFAFGAFIFVYRRNFSSRFLKVVFFMAILVSAIFLIIVFVATGRYIGETNGGVSDAVFNRFFATFDGLDYYLNFNGIERIDSGLNAYSLSIFGVYIQNLVGIEYKNIGWQLSELASGSVLSFAQGSNYTFILQGLVFSPYLTIGYVSFFAIFISSLRYLNLSSNLIKFFFVLKGYAFAIDIEYAFLISISFLIVYVLLLLIGLIFFRRFIW